IRGEPVDTRTDIWTFGCLLHEMLTAQPAFKGASPAEVMATVLRDDVDGSPRPPETPPPLRRLPPRSRRRDLRGRPQDIGEARTGLGGLGRDERDGPAPPMGGRRPRPAWPWLVVAAAVAVAVAAAIAVPIARRRSPAPPVPTARLSLELPEGLALADD